MTARTPACSDAVADMCPPFDFCFLCLEGGFWTESRNLGTAKEELEAWNSREAAFSE